MDLLKLERKTVKIVKQAAKIFKTKSAVYEKGGAENLVTDTDINIQLFLQRELHKILPQAGFLCEENDVADINREYVWVIDPIDGTTNFVRDIPEHAISVGLLHNNTSVLGVVFAPKLNLLFKASLGNGAYCNGKKINTSNKTLPQAIFCTALCLYQKNLAKPCLDIMYEVHQLCSDIRRLGSCAVELCYLAMGRCDIYFEIRVCPWDFAAAYIIVKEAGGIIKGYNKAEFDFSKKTVVIAANNEENFEKLNEIVSKNIKELPKYEG